MLITSTENVNMIVIVFPTKRITIITHTTKLELQTEFFGEWLI